MYAGLRSLLFKLEPETSHDVVMGALAVVAKSRVLSALAGVLAGRVEFAGPVEVMGIDFANPVGLAAGLDKQASAGNALHQFGFGWLEFGTVTPEPQPGNPKPRIFRIPEHQAIINRLGFNSVSLNRFISNLKRMDPKIIKGINIGKNAATPLKDAAQDYLTGLRAVYDHADYVAVNVSSPNTRGLRELQQHPALDALLAALNRQRQQLADNSGRYIPLVVKIAPDLDQAQIDVIAGILRRHKIDGVAATNTTLSRDAIAGHRFASEVGGLSGQPLQTCSTRVTAALYANLQGEIPIIGIGGINSPESALEKFQAGAKLIQLYSGFIYHGPKLIRDILSHINQNQ